MLDRRLGALLLGAGALGLYAARGLLYPTEVEFTRAALPAPAAIEFRPPVSTVQVALPLDLARIARRTEAALKQRLAMGLDATDATCARRPAPHECGFKLDNAVSLSGPVEAGLHGTSIRVKMPLKIDVAQGTERSTIEATMSFLLRLNSSNGLEVVRTDEPSSDASGANQKVVKLVETRLRPVSLTAQDELRAILAAMPVSVATQKAWAVLAEPIELGNGSNTFLKAIPEVAGTGDFGFVDGKAVLSVPIAARLSVETGPRGPSLNRRPLIQGQVNTAGGAAVRIATPINLNAMQAAAQETFVNGGVIETKPDRFGPPVKVVVRQTKLYPSARQIALELDIAATKFEGQTYRGKAHLVGRPVLDADQGIMTLADVTFPAAAQREAGNSKMPANAPRIAADPFAGKFAAISRVDLARDIAEAAARTSNLLNQRIGERMSLTARLDKATAISVETSKDGAWLVNEVSGTLAFVYEGEIEIAKAAPKDDRSAQPQVSAAPKSTTPEISPSAVVSAAAAAGSVAAKVIPSAAAAPTSQPTSTTPATTPQSLTAVTPPATTVEGSPAAAKRPQIKPHTHRPGSRSAALSKSQGGPKKEWIPWAAGN